MTKPTKPTNPRFFMTDVSKRQQRNDNLRNNAWAILIAVLIVFALPLLLSVIATR